MATKQSTIDYICEQISAAGAVVAKKMFGEYALYCDSKLVALVCDEKLFVKPTEAGRAFLGNVIEVPPYPGAKPSFLIVGETWDDAERLAYLVRVTAAALSDLPVKKSKLRAKKPR